jgi:hypothetical protein
VGCIAAGPPEWLVRLKNGLALVLLRDRHPVLRDPLDLVRLSFVVGALVYALLDDWDATVRLLAPAVFMFIVRAIDVPRPVDWAFCLAMIFQGWGSALRLFSEGALITLCLGVTAASFYEICEWAVDHWFGQHPFIGETDTITDLADGFLGGGTGGVFLATWGLTRYTSRRLPRPI